MFKDENRHYSLRKLSVGLASVLIGISFASMTGNSVHADTVESGNNSVQTVVKGSDAAVKIGAKDDANAIESNTESADEATKRDPNAIAQDIKQKATKGDTPEAAMKNATDGSEITTKNTLKGSDSLTVNNDAVKDTVEVAKQGLETPAVLHNNSNETTLNVNGSKAEVKESQNLNDPAKSKLKTATLMTTTGKKFNTKMLFASKVVSPANDTNGGFDSSWGKLNVNDWKGNVQGDYYQLTSYTGDADHVIVPNEADFAKAGISTSGKQVGVTSDLMHTIFRDNATAQDATVAFSKTDNKQVKAIGADWSNTWGHDSEYINGSDIRSEGYLTKFDGTNLDVSNVTNMSYMFEHNQISDLSSLTNWDVSHVTDMHSMFREMAANNFSALSNWNVSNVTDMSEMFNIASVRDLSPFANWNVSKVTNMNSMFSLGYISDLSPLANWDVSNVTDMGAMFSYCQQISHLSPLTNWKVDKVTNMGQMFAQSQISDLSPLTNWKVDNVRNMQGMFEYNQIGDLSPLTNWKVGNVGNMSDMFEYNQIGDLSPISGWNVNNVTDMSGMFDDNSGSKTKTATAKRIIDFVYPAGYTGKKQDSITQTVDLPQKVTIELTTKDSKPSNNILDWVTKTETPEAPAPVYFQDYTVPEIKGLLEPDKTVISRQQVDVTKPINVTVTYKLVESNTNDAFALDSKNGLHEHANVNDNGGYDEDYWGKINVDDWNYTVNGDRIEIDSLKYGISTGANDAVIVPNLDDFKLAGKDGGAKTVYISNSALGKTAKHKYYGLSKTNDNKFATDSDIRNAFSSTGNLTHVDLNSLNTSNVTNMGNMFYGASSLTSLDVSKWDTSNVTDMSLMFYGTSDLTSPDVSKWDTGNVTDMNAMFYGASSLTSLDVSKWDTSKVTSMYDMFGGASSLTSLDVSKWDTSNVTNMNSMFNSASSLTSLDVSKWDTSKVTSMYDMFGGASSLTSLDVSNWDTGNVTDMSYMFCGANGLTALDVSKWDTGEVTDMSHMFNYASNLNSLDVSKWDTSNVTDMSYMFDSASRLTSLDVSNWDTSNVTNMNSMFNSASKLMRLDVSKWDTGNVTDMSLMFYGTSDLTSLDVSKWDTSNVTDMYWMFDGASSLKSLDVSKWNTSNVTNMNLMFEGASSLTSLDVSNWNTGNVTDMSYMFDGASRLTSLDVSKWDTGKVTNMHNMFYEASSLTLIANSGKFADYLINHDSFAESNVDSSVKSVTTDNTKLLQLLTNDAQHNSATRTVVFTFPANYSPDLTKYHLTKNGNTYQIKQSANYDKSYLQGTVLINATYGIAYHHIDTTKPYKLSDTWQPNYDKLVLAHKNSDGSVSFDTIRLPKVPGYKAIVKTVANPINPASALFAVSFMALPKPATPAINDTKPAETVTPTTPEATEVARPIETEPKVATTPKVIDLSNDVVTTTPDVSAWHVADEPEQDTYHVSNGQYAVELPHISNAQLHVIANDSTKDSILFTYKGQNTKYVFNIKFVDGHYLLTTYEIKSGKLVKLIDYNFIKSSKMIDVILDWLQFK